MIHYPLLTLLILIPLLGAGALFLLAHPSGTISEKQRNKNARAVALWVSTINFFLAGFVFMRFDASFNAMQFVEYANWLPQLNVAYHLGVDGISILLISLSAALTPLCVLASWKSIGTRVPAFMAALLCLEAFIIGAFCALDAILFYFFWEATLVPIFFIMGIWGGDKRIFASLKHFLYMAVSSALVLFAFLYMGTVVGSFSILELHAFDFTPHVQLWLFAALFVAFAMRMPLWPVHTWLMDTHVQAPTALSVLITGVLMNIGVYGLLRFHLPLFPEAAAFFTPAISALGVITFIVAALIAFNQKDIKKMLAYASVSHMGLITLGLVAGTQMAVEGAVLHMLNRSIISAALFLMAGFMYERMRTRNLMRFGGIINTMPVYATLFFIMTLATIGVPGTSGFVSAFMILSGTFPALQIATLLACAGLIFTAAYMLKLYRHMIMNPLEHDDVKSLKPLSLREGGMLIPCAVMVILLGFQPSWALTTMRPTIEALTNGEPALIHVEEKALPSQNSKQHHGGH